MALIHEVPLALDSPCQWLLGRLNMEKRWRLINEINHFWPAAKVSWSERERNRKRKGKPHEPVVVVDMIFVLFFSSEPSLVPPATFYQTYSNAKAPDWQLIENNMWNNKEKICLCYHFDPLKKKSPSKSDSVTGVNSLFQSLLLFLSHKTCIKFRNYALERCHLAIFDISVLLCCKNLLSHLQIVTDSIINVR